MSQRHHLVRLTIAVLAVTALASGACGSDDTSSTTTTVRSGDAAADGGTGTTEPRTAETSSPETTDPDGPDGPDGPEPTTTPPSPAGPETDDPEVAAFCAEWVAIDTEMSARADEIDYADPEQFAAFVRETVVVLGQLSDIAPEPVASDLRVLSEALDGLSPEELANPDAVMLDPEAEEASMRFDTWIDTNCG